MKNKKVKEILNGHNEGVNKATRLLSEPLMKMVMECRNKEGEELAGIMNFWFMEIERICRKAGAIGYLEGKHKMEE